MLYCCCVVVIAHVLGELTRHALGCRANVHLGPSQSAASTLSPSKNEPAVDTSYEYYVDPRITVAWCKRLGKDWKKIVTGKMQHVHAWADDTDADFVF